MTQQKADYPLDYSKGPAADTKQRLQGMADAAGERFQDASDQVQDLANQVSEQAREYGEKAQEVARQFKPFVEKSLKEQPMTTLAGAAAIGFLLGALWKK
jgi:ElaB/YqjD/DUF883 family membrane-anchored ribosome-binding protein